MPVSVCQHHHLPTLASFPRYEAIVELARKLNFNRKTAEIRAKAVWVIASMFPSFLPPAFKVLVMHACVRACPCVYMLHLCSAV